MQLMDFWQFDFSKFKLPLITVYKNPLDYPDSYVARLWDVDVVQNIFIVKDTLEEIREAIPTHRFYRLIREPWDEDIVVETWV